jgi:hypothetical protein
MPYTTPTVSYAESNDLGVSYTALTGIQSISISRGRQRFQDNFPQSSCTIELIPATSYALPLAVGQVIDVRDANDADSPAYFVGIISDINRQYQFPYDTVSGYAPADRITITATGPTGALGKQSLSNYSFPSQLVDTTVFDFALSFNVSAFTYIPSTVSSTGQTFTGGTLDLTNTLLRTQQYLIDDVDNNRVGDTFFPPLTSTVTTFPAGQGNVNYTFSDAGTVGAFKFSNLQYSSSVQNTFKQVQVVSPGNATQSATSGTAPYNTLVYDTYALDATQALNLANFILSTKSIDIASPYSISTNTNLSDNCTDISKLSNLNDLSAGNLAMNLGASVTIIFRGTTATAQIQGINTTFYIDHAAVQLYLSPSLGTAFTLDSTVFGILGGTGIIYNTPMDYNEAGYVYNDDTADNGNRLGYP